MGGIALSPAIVDALCSGDGAYEASTAFTVPEMHKLCGEWCVLEHSVAGIPYLERFCAARAPALVAAEARYECRYTFREGLCAKRVTVEGRCAIGEHAATYLYRQALAATWAVLPGGLLRIEPVLGYQASYLDGSPAMVAELPAACESEVLHYRIEGGELCLEAGAEYKRLGRVV